jgi:hypothetical protein
MELQRLHGSERIGKIAGDPRAIVGQDDVEWERSRGGRIQQSLQPWAPLDARSRNSRVSVDMRR